MKHREMGERKCVWEGRVCSGFCAWNWFELCGGLRPNHGTSPDRAEFPRVHDAREKHRR
jgi:hypothetical protein